MKQIRISLVTLGMLLVIALPAQTVGAITSIPFVFPPASRSHFSLAAQLSLFDRAALPALDVSWRGGRSQLQAGLPNVEANNPSQDGKSLQRTQDESAVAIFGSHVVVGFNDTTGFHFHNGHLLGCFSGYAYSSDGGASFTDGGCTPPPPGGVTYGDPVLVADPTGAFYFAQVMQDAQGNEYMGVSKSTDFGKTWTRPVAASPEVHTGNNGVPFQDKDWLSVGINPSNHSQFILYGSWTHFTQTAAIIQVSRSTDGGSTWSAPVDLQNSPGVQGSFTTEDPGTGEVYAFWTNSTKGTNLDIVESFSMDGGQTWSTPKAIYSLMQAHNAIVSCGGNKRGVIQFIPGDTQHVALNASLPQASVDPVTHDVYVVVDEKVAKSVNVALLSSSDGGSTWHAQLIAQSSQPQFQSSISVDQHGVHLEYYQVKSDGTYYEAGINGNHAVPPVLGQPFAVTNRTLQPPLDNPTSDPVIAPCAMGDYNHMASDGHSITYSWSDSRNFNKSGQDVWTATTSG